MRQLQLIVTWQILESPRIVRVDTGGGDGDANGLRWGTDGGGTWGCWTFPFWVALLPTYCSHPSVSHHFHFADFETEAPEVIHLKLSKLQPHLKASVGQFTAESTQCRGQLWGTKGSVIVALVSHPGLQRWTVPKAAAYPKEGDRMMIFPGNSTHVWGGCAVCCGNHKGRVSFSLLFRSR